MLNRRERTELCLIPLIGLGMWMVTPILPEQVGIGSFVLTCSCILLLQGLIRDLFLLVDSSKTSPPGQVKKARCICLESTVGICGIILGIIFFATDSGKDLEMTTWCWSLSAMATLGSGFLMKDYVLGWKPLRISKDKDHMNLIVRWRH